MATETHSCRKMWRETKSVHVAKPTRERDEMARAFSPGYFHIKKNVFSIIEPDHESGELFRLQLDGNLVRRFLGWHAADAHAIKIAVRGGKWHHAHRRIARRKLFAQFF